MYLASVTTTPDYSTPSLLSISSALSLTRHDMLAKMSTLLNYPCRILIADITIPTADITKHPTSVSCIHKPTNPPSDSPAAPLPPVRLPAALLLPPLGRDFPLAGWRLPKLAAAMAELPESPSSSMKRAGGCTAGHGRGRWRPKGWLSAVNRRDKQPSRSPHLKSSLIVCTRMPPVQVAGMRACTNPTSIHHLPPTLQALLLPLAPSASQHSPDTGLRSTARHHTVHPYITA